MKEISLILIFSVIVSVLAACSSSQTPPETPELVVMAHDSFSVSEELVAEFEAETGSHVSFLLSGDTGAALNRAILTRDSPLADVFFGVDNTFLSRALNADIFEPYHSPLVDQLPEAFQLDPTYSLLPVDYGDVCLNYDIGWFQEHNLAIPSSLDDLTLPEYNGLLVVENPAISSPGLAFLLTTIAVFGEDGYLNYWQELRDNGVIVVNDWSTAYNMNYSAASGQGAQPMVVSYATSPAAEVIYADPPITEPPSAAIVAPNMCFRQIEFAGILRGTSQRSLAERFIDFMLSIPFQEDIPNQMLMFPTNVNASLPEVFAQYARQANAPAQIDLQTLEQNRERWIAAWTEVVLH